MVQDSSDHDHSLVVKIYMHKKTILLCPYTKLTLSVFNWLTCLPDLRLDSGLYTTAKWMTSLSLVMRVYILFHENLYFYRWIIPGALINALYKIEILGGIQNYIVHLSITSSGIHSVYTGLLPQ